MTREEAINMLYGMRADNLNLDDLYTKDKYEALDAAIKALEQDTVPFDFELYQAGLMDMPKGMIEVLDKIRAEIKQLSNANPSYWHRGDMVDRAEALDIIDKYKAESEDKE